jgi:hypothetical protein
MDKREKRRMLDRLIELRDRYGRLDSADRIAALPLADLEAHITEAWATAAANDARLAAEAAAKAAAASPADAPLTNG